MVEQELTQPRPPDAQPPDTAKLSLINVGGKQLPWRWTRPRRPVLTKKCNPVIVTTTLYTAGMWSFPGCFLFKFHKSYKMGSMYLISQRSEKATIMPKSTHSANEGRSHDLNLIWVQMLSSTHSHCYTQMSPIYIPRFKAYAPKGNATTNHSFKPGVSSMKSIVQSKKHICQRNKV